MSSFSLIFLSFSQRFAIFAILNFPLTISILPLTADPGLVFLSSHIDFPQSNFRKFEKDSRITLHSSLILTHQQIRGKILEESTYSALLRDSSICLFYVYQNLVEYSTKVLTGSFLWSTMSVDQEAIPGIQPTERKESHHGTQ